MNILFFICQYFKQSLSHENNSNISFILMHFRNILLTETGDTKWMLPDEKTKIYDVNLRLPENVTCTQCILQVNLSHNFKSGNYR